MKKCITTNMSNVIKFSLFCIWIGINQICAQTKIEPIKPWTKFYPHLSNSIEASKIIGKVKTIKQIEYEGESNFFEAEFQIDSFSIEGVIQKKYYYEDGSGIIDSIEYKYDSIGKLKNEIHHNDDGTIEYTKYFYNENGDLVLKDSPFERIDFIWYLNHKKLKTKISYNKSTKNNSGYTCFYNKNGDLIEWKEFKNDTVIDRFTIKYQKKNEIALYNYFGNEKKYSFYDVYYFNDNNLLSKTEKYWGNSGERKDKGRLHKIEFYEYDKYNCLIKSIPDTDEKDLDEIYEYEYDSFGNWIKFTEKRNGEITTKIRKISYY
jgi:hypothetical protein